ncbi:MAG: hypothetical protein ABSG63_04315 [Spirochaetia bacterium]
MTEINRLLDEYGALCDSAENQRRLSLWETGDRWLRGETQFQGIPRFTTETGRACGDITRHVPEIDRLDGVALLDFGVTMEDKGEGMKGLRRPPALELRVMAKRHIQEASEEAAKAYVHGIIAACRDQA